MDNLEQRFKNLYELVILCIKDHKFSISDFIKECCDIKYIFNSINHLPNTKGQLYGVGEVKFVRDRLMVVKNKPFRFNVPLDNWLWENNFIKEETIWKIQQLMFRRI